MKDIETNLGLENVLSTSTIKLHLQNVSITVIDKSILEIMKNQREIKSMKIFLENIESENQESIYKELGEIISYQNNMIELELQKINLKGVEGEIFLREIVN